MTHLFEPQTIHDIVYATPEERQKVLEIVNGTRPFPSDGKAGILLYGPPGTGKTSLAELLPNAIEAQRTGNSDAKAYVIKEACLPGKNGTSQIQSLATSLKNYSTNESGLHYIVLNEADNLTKQARDQLKSLMEIPGVIFVLTTNRLEVFSGPVQSRSVSVSFEPMSPAPLADRVEHFLKIAGVTTYTRQWVEAKVRSCRFDCREVFYWLRGVV